MGTESEVGASGKTPFGPSTQFWEMFGKLIKGNLAADASKRIGEIDFK